MDFQIIIYTTPTCPWCEKLKAWLKKRRLHFEERDTTLETRYYDEVIEKTGQMAVPVIDIEGKILVGFDEKALEKAIETAKKV